MNNKQNKLCLIIMAAGTSKRYKNGNKLLDKFYGKRMVDILIDILPKKLFDSIIAVTSDNEVLKIFNDNKIKTVINNDPDRGVGSTVKLGLFECDSNADGYMFLVCDQPFLSKKTITELIEFWSNNKSNICALAYGEKMGNPVIFPKSLFNQLYNLKDNKNGKVVIDQNKHMLKKYYIKDKRELFDVDTVSDLNLANNLNKKN